MVDPKVSFLEYKERIKKNYYSANRSDDQNLEWLHPIKVTLGILQQRSFKLSIYKVPSKIRRLNEEAYTPRVVSIGPFHQNKVDLMAMEEHKWRHMMSLFHRTQDPESCLNECGKAVLEMEGGVRGSYADSIKFDSKQLAEIMLVDGCFIVELFLRNLLNDMVAYTDPILHNAWIMPTLRYDLTLLENQIPFFVLQHLFDIVAPRMTQHVSLSITALSLSFFHPELELELELDLGQEVIKEKYRQDVSHLLHLLHIFYLPNNSGTNPSAQRKETWGFKNCATNLLEAGIQFEKASEKEHLLDITFSNGAIKIPTLFINETTNSLLRNLIAFEQCSLGGAHHVTSYVVLMKSLIHSPRDSELLEGKGIINKDLGGVEDVLSLFKRILEEVVLKDFYFGWVCEEVNEYHNLWWHRQRLKASWRVRCHRYGAALKLDHFSNPWRIIAFVAALLLLLLTAAQTFYTVRAYYPR